MHRYERWFLEVSLVVLALFVVVIVYGAVVRDIPVPAAQETIDPATVLQDPRFSPPYVRPAGGGAYEAWVVALQFGYIPDPIEVPANSTVRFHVTAMDVIHGFYIPGTGINAMLLPGYITSFDLAFGAPGDIGVVCHEYCGAGHHFMEALIVVQEGEG